MVARALRRRHPIRSASAVLVTALLLGVTAAQAIPSRSAARSTPQHEFPGLLVAVDRSSDVPQPSIWTIVPGSANSTRIAHAAVPLIAPDFSPGGDQIAFNRDAFGHGDARDTLVLVRADGSDKHVVREACSGTCRWFDDLSWAPDDQTILMWRCVGKCPASGYHSSYAIWSIHTDGTDLRQLTFPGAYTHTSKLNDHSPEVSPDGSSFLFDRFDDVTGRSTIEVASVSGGAPAPVPLPDAIDPGEPIWTPDGSRILFQSPHDLFFDKPINLFTVAPDGTDLEQITHYHVPTGQHFAGVFHPSFSPDGLYIAATHMFSPSGYSYVILSPDGQLVARVPIGPNLVDMEWGPKATILRGAVAGSR